MVVAADRRKRGAGGRAAGPVVSPGGFWRPVQRWLGGTASDWRRKRGPDTPGGGARTARSARVPLPAAVRSLGRAPWLAKLPPFWRGPAGLAGGDRPLPPLLLGAARARPALGLSGAGPLGGHGHGRWTGGGASLERQGPCLALRPAVARGADGRGLPVGAGARDPGQCHGPALFHHLRLPAAGAAARVRHPGCAHSSRRDRRLISECRTRGTLRRSRRCAPRVLVGDGMAELRGAGAGRRT